MAAVVKSAERTSTNYCPTNERTTMKESYNKAIGISIVIIYTAIMIIFFT